MASQHPRTTPAPTRRAVLGAAAWSVPVVTLASAAPAYALSHDRLTITSATATWAPVLSLGGLVGYYLQFSITVRNDGHDDTSGLQVSLTFPSDYGNVRVSTFGGNVGTGWSNGTFSNRTFVSASNAQLSPNQSSTLLTQGRIYVPTNPAGSGPAITIQATSGGGFASGVAVVNPT